MKIKPTQLKKLIEVIVNRKLQERAVLNEAFASPELNKLWRLIKRQKWDRENQRDMFQVLRRSNHLGKVAWDKIPSEAVKIIPPSEAKNRKDAINIWVTEKQDRAMLGKGYRMTTVPVLAVTRGKKMLWNAGGEKRADTSSGYGTDTRMGGVGAGDVSFSSIQSLVDYVISIDIMKAKGTAADAAAKVANRAAQKAGALRASKGYKQQITKYISREDSSTGKSYSFVKDAARGIAKANKARYKKIIADRVSEQGTEPADKLIRLAMEISQELTRKFVDEKPIEKDDVFGYSGRMKFDVGAFGFDARDIMNTMSSAFSAYQDVIRYHGNMQGDDNKGRYSQEFKTQMDYLKRYTDDMVKYRKKLKTA